MKRFDLSLSVQGPLRLLTVSIVICWGLMAGGVDGYLQAAEPLKVCLFSGAPLYDSDESLDLLAEYLKANWNVEVSRISAPVKDRLRGLDALDQCDVLLLYTRRLEIAGPELEKIQKYFAQGRPVVGVRTASHAFQNWLEFDKQVLGGDYKGHFAAGPLTEVAAVTAEHPILQDFRPFQSEGSLYRNAEIAEDTTLLLTGTTPDGTHPVAWTRLHNGGRVFYTSLGHQKDFQQAEYLELLARALYWASNRTPEHK